MQILAWYHEENDIKGFKSSLLRSTKMPWSEEAQTNVLLVAGWLHVLPQEDKIMMKYFQHWE